MAPTHRQGTPTMTVAQAQQLCVSYGATFKVAKGDVSWWVLPDKTWLGVKTVAGGLVEVRRVSAEACGCS